MKKILVAFLMLCILILSVSCKGSGTGENDTTSSVVITEATTTLKRGTGTFSLFFSMTDSLNPYQAITQGNKQISPLMYDSLIKINERFCPEFVLANTIDLKDKKCTITLKNMHFSDGSLVTGSDVTFSLYRAKEATTNKYAEQLSNVEEANTTSTGVTITLKKYDPLFVNNLDFPIIKKGTTDKKDENGRVLPPIGSGRYIYSTENGKSYLTPNSSYYIAPAKNKVLLIHTPDEQSLEYNVKSGAVDFYFSDMRDGKLPSMQGKKQGVVLTNFIFAGVNTNKVLLKIPEIRQAISFAVDRKSMAKNSYYGNAQPAYAPFITGFLNSKQVDVTLTEISDLQKVVELLQKKGYNKKNSDNIYENASGNIISVSILYNNDNDLHFNVAKQMMNLLKIAGIKAEIVGKPFSEYNSLVSSKNYDLFIGEIKLSNNFDLSSLLNITGIVNSETTTTKKSTESTSSNSQTMDSIGKFNEAYIDYINGKKTIGDFYKSFHENMPLVPLLFKEGVLIYNNSIDDQVKSSVSDIYYNFSELSK